MVAQAMRQWEVMQSNHAQCFVYFGEREGWYKVLGQHRDSDALTRSNFRVVYAALSAQFGDSVAIERSSHWAVGWSEVILVNPEDSAAVNAAGDWLDRLEDYPVASDDDFSALEDEEGICGYCGQWGGQAYQDGTSPVCDTCQHDHSR